MKSFTPSSKSTSLESATVIVGVNLVTAATGARWRGHQGRPNRPLSDASIRYLTVEMLESTKTEVNVLR
jgi:hypothetical protein